jgi:RNA polymerase sigma-70 factor, ECF subfamily
MSSPVYGEAPDVDQYLKDARAGSHAALGGAFEACRRYLLLVAEKELGPELRAKGGASDLVQETFLEAQRDFGRFRGESRGEFRVWLHRILMHNVGAFARQFRDTRKRSVAREVGLRGASASGGQVVDLAGSTATPSAQVAAREHLQALRAALDRLPEDYRRVITLRYDGNLTFEQIGREMGRSPEAARKVWARAMACLRNEWANP